MKGGYIIQHGEKVCRPDICCGPAENNLTVCFFPPGVVTVFSVVLALMEDSRDSLDITLTTGVHHPANHGFQALQASRHAPRLGHGLLGLGGVQTVVYSTLFQTLATWLLSVT